MYKNQLFFFSKLKTIIVKLHYIVYNTLDIVLSSLIIFIKLGKRAILEIQILKYVK